MSNFSFLGIRVQQLRCFYRFKLTLTCLRRSMCLLLSCVYDCLLLLNLSPFLVQLCYFVLVSAMGFWVLKATKPRTDPSRPRSLDLLFTSVSATSVSSMATVEMEVFSNTQLIVLTLLMFLGMEAFISMVCLHLRASKLKRKWELDSNVDNVCTSNSSKLPLGIPNNKHYAHDQLHIQLELVETTGSDHNNPKPALFPNEDHSRQLNLCGAEFSVTYKSIRFLGFVVLGYLIMANVVGVFSVVAYLTTISSAKDVLEKKGLNMLTFSVFTTVSTFTNCGFIPTNENMVVFSKNAGLLLLLIPQVLLGNTLFAPSLRCLIWILRKFVKTGEDKYHSELLLKKTKEIGYSHLLPGLHSWLLVATVFGFILIQVVVFCALEWDSEALNGLNVFQKFIGVVFVCVNSRHSGESIMDISVLSPAILVLFILMMYLPPYTSYLPVIDDCPEQRREWKDAKQRKTFVESIIFSQLSYLVIFIILICITERRSMKEDPVNFSVLNIVLETISAYGNVGFSTGYSCDRRLKLEGGCENKIYGFAGRWTDEGKIILMVVMIFGRLKKFNMEGGRSWKLQ